MYEFLYNYIKRKYNVNLVFADTESLVYENKTNDTYKDFYRDKNFFDLSDYPQNSKFFDPVNKKMIRNMKNKVKGKMISEFVRLKSKIH